MAASISCSIPLSAKLSGAMEMAAAALILDRIGQDGVRDSNRRKVVHRALDEHTPSPARCWVGIHVVWKLKVMFLLGQNI